MLLDSPPGSRLSFLSVVRRDTHASVTINVPKPVRMKINKASSAGDIMPSVSDGHTVGEARSGLLDADQPCEFLIPEGAMRSIAGITCFAKPHQNLPRANSIAGQGAFSASRNSTASAHRCSAQQRTAAVAWRSLRLFCRYVLHAGSGYAGRDREANSTSQRSSLSQRSFTGQVRQRVPLSSWPVCRQASRSVRAGDRR